MVERVHLNLRLPIAAVAVGVTLLFGVGVILLKDWNTERELRIMPDDTRRALFERIQETVRGSCSHAKSDELRDYCEEQAQFLTRFPECEATCQDLCKRYAARATK